LYGLGAQIAAKQRFTDSLPDIIIALLVGQLNPTVPRIVPQNFIFSPLGYEQAQYTQYFPPLGPSTLAGAAHEEPLSTQETWQILVLPPCG
jgi:hypothetical protein